MQTHDRTSALMRRLVCGCRTCAREEVGDELRLIRHLPLGRARDRRQRTRRHCRHCVFLRGLDRVTELRLGHRWLIALLPLAGLAVGVVHLRRWAGDGRQRCSRRSTSRPRGCRGGWLRWCSRRHVGHPPVRRLRRALRHGIADGREPRRPTRRALRMRAADRRMLLTAALGGGFGACSACRSPAGFALEVPAIGRPRYGRSSGARASVTGDLVVTGLGYHHGARRGESRSSGRHCSPSFAVVGCCAAWPGALRRVTHPCASCSLPASPGCHCARLSAAAVVGLAVLFGTSISASLPLLDELRSPASTWHSPCSR